MKVISLFSGGLDSTVLLSFLKQKRCKVYPLTINYGQRHEREIQASKEVCKVLNIKTQKIIDISDISQLLMSSSLIDKTGDLSAQELAIVPNRNAILLSLATAWAVSMNTNYVAFAGHKSDNPYPDCTNMFIRKFEMSMREGNNREITILNPFINMEKWEVVKEGMLMGSPIEKSYSCYKGNKEPCGKCHTCLERKDAINKATKFIVKNK